LSSVRK